MITDTWYSQVKFFDPNNTNLDDLIKAQTPALFNTWSDKSS